MHWWGKLTFILQHEMYQTNNKSAIVLNKPVNSCLPRLFLTSLDLSSFVWRELTGLFQTSLDLSSLYDVNWQDCFRQVLSNICLMHFTMTGLFQTRLNLSSFLWYKLTGYLKTSLDLSSICLMHFTMMWNRYVVK